MYGTSVDTVGIEAFMKNGAYILCVKSNLNIIYIYFSLHIYRL